MKKAIFLIAVLLLIPSLVKAQTSREASGSTITHAGRTNLTNLALLGLNKAGNPGYLVLTGVTADTNSFVPEYYLWVDHTGDLCLASIGTIENADTTSDFPEGDWNNFNSACSKVGSQS